MKRPLQTSLAMGLICAVIGAATGALVVAIATGSGYTWFLVAAPVAAFLTGAPLWWLLVARRARYSTGLGVLAGALAGALAHYVCWYLVLAGAATCHALSGGCTDSLGGAPVNAIEAFAAAGVYSLFSMLFLGWLTVPGGAILGGLLAYAQRRPA